MREGVDALEQRTKQFAIDVINLSIALERLAGLRQLAWQLTAAAGSVGANHRAMRRARSMREFAAKLQVVNEEIDEAVFWLEVARASDPTHVPEGLTTILAEALELRSIFAKARATTNRRSS